MSDRSRLIAILDDEEPVRIALGRLLHSAGFQIECFASGKQFVESLSNRVPDCLVLDLHMSGLTGLDVLNLLITKKVRIPTVMITGHDMQNMKERALAAGADSYLIKPLDDSVLISAVQDSIEKKITTN